MFVRLNVVRSTGVEQVQVDMPSWNPITGEELPVTPESLKDDVGHILSIMDERAAQAQLRLLQVHGVFQYFPLDIQSKIIQIVDILTGQADAAYVVRQWQAETEENTALAEARALHAANGVGYDTPPE